MQRVTLLSSACDLTALQNATALSAPCSYDSVALRAPACRRMFGKPLAAATSTPASRAAGYGALPSPLSPMASHPGGPSGGRPPEMPPPKLIRCSDPVSPYFLSSGQSAGLLMKSNALNPS